MVKNDIHLSRYTSSWISMYGGVPTSSRGRKRLDLRDSSTGYWDTSTGYWDSPTGYTGYMDSSMGRWDSSSGCWDSSTGYWVSLGPFLTELLSDSFYGIGPLVGDAVVAGVLHPSVMGLDNHSPSYQCRNSQR